ncbi:hypothetical protein OG372_00190 [Streptomyces sp. NBC_01020]|uniref:hypothetical protein n=1 Tax=Streptomyces sp. NBC_01020 TaxID=2903722 RepID=UPI00386AE4CC|nr:hypothetical protein OG372_00190 [Streptomyces sp. NBC_01020]
MGIELAAALPKELPQLDNTVGREGAADLRQVFIGFRIAALIPQLNDHRRDSANGERNAVDIICLLMRTADSACTDDGWTP